ncbi:ribonuclease HI family protein [Candidatus Microgenomates bacterium]|nr:ribonuclease HI family protein [Candidatus Microgenomates bacterium]
MKLIIYTDGASRGNPGPAAYGFTIQDENGKLLYEEGKYIGVTTNNVAEYTAVLEVLKHVTKHAREKFAQEKLQVELYADSKLVAEQLSGRYKIKAKHLKPIIEQIQKLAIEVGGIIFSHVPRSQNTQADRLANQALDNKLR